jgi:hypothetical protein
MDSRTLRWLALLLPLASAGADAAVITATFSGTITEFDAQLADGTFVVGEPVSGSFVIDSEAVDSEPLPNEANYDLAVTDISVEFGAYPATSPTGHLFIRNGTAQPDEFGVSESFRLKDKRKPGILPTPAKPAKIRLVRPYGRNIRTGRMLTCASRKYSILRARMDAWGREPSSEQRWPSPSYMGLAS